jgi:hypothetical protein
MPESRRNPRVTLGGCQLYPLLMAARNVREIVNVCKAHRLTCTACGGARKPVASETTAWRRERAA